jgi:hypothetical protein
MNRTPVFFATSLLATMSFCGAGPTFAQDVPPQDQPKPAGREYQPFGDDQDASQPENNLAPDVAPLTGALVPGVGSQEMRHSYWVPGLQYGNLARSNSVNQRSATSSDWNSTSFVSGNLSLLLNSSHSQFAANYSGGGTFSTDASQGNGYYHQLALAQYFHWRRLQLSFVDQFSYLPESQFGFGAGSTLAIPGVSGSLGPSVPGLQTSYQPSQSIFTSLGPRYSNSITAEMIYALSPRGSMTFTGSYGILRFVDPGNIESNDSIFSVGYDYALSKQDTIGVVYRFAGYRYLGQPQAIQDHVANFAYGRKITGRLALQLFAGPEYTTFRVHTAGVADRISASVGANLTYALQRTGFSVSYNHGVGGGSGAFTGSNSDTVQGGINRQLSRVWSGNISFGYARNSSLASGRAAQPSTAFNSWFAGAGLARPLGRTANFSLGYSAYLQELNQGGCPAGACTLDVQHQVSASFQWHTRPLVLR